MQKQTIRRVYAKDIQNINNINIFKVLNLCKNKDGTIDEHTNRKYKRKHQ